MKKFEIQRHLILRQSFRVVGKDCFKESIWFVLYHFG